MLNHRLLFYSAAVFNFCAALPFLLAPDLAAQLAGVELNPGGRFLLQVVFLMVLTFGFVYGLIGKDPLRYRPYILLGAVLKLQLGLPLINHLLSGHIGPGMPLLWLGDVVYAFLFIRYYLATRPNEARIATA